MPIPEYQTEKDFRQQWIGPFLSKMGFILPKHIHGADEQGKDFFFMDHDRFGHLRFYSAQAKLGNVGAGAELTALLDQVERSFEVTLKYHQGAHDQRIAAVYVMITGKFSQQAREQLHAKCRQRSYGENIICLNGEQLDNLERTATYQRDSNFRQRLVALLNEATYNTGPTNKLMQSCSTGKPDFNYCRTIALEDAFRNSLPESEIPYDLLSRAWILLGEHNRWITPLQPPHDAASIATFARLGNSEFNDMIRIRDACIKAIAKLDAQYSLSIEVASIQQGKSGSTHD